jgi:hypothetical protein
MATKEGGFVKEGLILGQVSFFCVEDVGFSMFLEVQVSVLQAIFSA